MQVLNYGGCNCLEKKSSSKTLEVVGNTGEKQNMEKNKIQCIMQGQSCFYGGQQHDEMTHSNINHATGFLNVKWNNNL